MADDKKKAEVLDDDALEDAVGGGAQGGMGLTSETNDEGDFSAASSGSTWAKPFKKVARQIN